MFSLFLPTAPPPPQAPNLQLVHLQRLPPRLFRCSPQYVGVGTVLPSWQMQQQQHDVCPPRRTMFGRVQWYPLSGMRKRLRQTRHDMHEMPRWCQYDKCLYFFGCFYFGAVHRCSGCLFVPRQMCEKCGKRRWVLWAIENHLDICSDLEFHAWCV